MICLQAPTLSATSTVHTLLVVALMVALCGRRLAPATMRSECLHAVIDAYLREGVGTPPLAVMLPCPAI